MQQIREDGFRQKFEWLDGTNVDNTYSNFALGEPNNHQGNENCGVLSVTQHYLWLSETCESRQFYICQKEIDKLANKWIKSRSKHFRTILKIDRIFVFIFLVANLFVINKIKFIDVLINFYAFFVVGLK